MNENNGRSNAIRSEPKMRSVLIRPTELSINCVVIINRDFILRVYIGP